MCFITRLCIQGQTPHLERETQPLLITVRDSAKCGSDVYSYGDLAEGNFKAPLPCLQQRDFTVLRCHTYRMDSLTFTALRFFRGPTRKNIVAVILSNKIVKWEN